MGRQRGIVHLSGQFDDVQLSIDGKKGTSKISVPLSKERIKTAAEFLNTRRVNVEFKAASKAADTMQNCLRGKAITYGDRYFRARLQTAFLEAVRKGSGDFGQRSLEVQANCDALKEVQLNKMERFKNRFNTSFNLQVNPDRNTATLTVPAFPIDPRTLQMPEGATHFIVYVCIGVLGDLVYASSDGRYVPANPQTNGLSSEAASALLPASGQNLGFQVVASLPGLPILATSEGFVVSLAIEFFFVVNGTPVLKAAGNAMDIIDVY